MVKHYTSEDCLGILERFDIKPDADKRYEIELKFNSLYNEWISKCLSFGPRELLAVTLSVYSLVEDIDHVNYFIKRLFESENQFGDLLEPKEDGLERVVLARNN